MTIVSAVAALLSVIVILVLISGRSMDTSRAILVHAPLESVWAEVRDFGALHARHARGRPLLRIETSTLLEGNGLVPGSVWRQGGRRADAPYWAEIELLDVDPQHRLAVQLKRDSLGTHNGLLRHRCELRLTREDDCETKIVLRMSARLSGVRLPFLRRLSPESLRPRLLDLAMRSVKLALSATARAGDAEDRRDREGAIGERRVSDLPMTPPEIPPSLGDRV